MAKNSMIRGYSMYCQSCRHEWTMEKEKYSPDIKCPECRAMYSSVIMGTLDAQDFNSCQMIDLGFAKKIEWWS